MKKPKAIDPRFDYPRLVKIINLLPINPKEAKVRLEQYLDDYPYNYYAKAYYFSILIAFNETDNLESEIEDLLETIKDIEKYRDITFNSVKDLLTRNRVDLLARQGKFSELYDIYFSPTAEPERQNEIQNLGTYGDVLRVYCKKKLIDDGMLPEDAIEKIEISSYLFLQIHDYQESFALKHVYNHSIESSNKSKSYFAEFFPIEKAIQEVVEMKDKLIPYKVSSFSDSYIIKCHGCGRTTVPGESKKHVITDYFRIAFFHGTNDIIAMHPFYNQSNEQDDCIDLSYLMYPEQPVQSQIEKFNNRLARKKPSQK